MKALNILVLIMLSGLMFLTACDKKKSGKSSPARVARGGTSQPYIVQGVNNQGANNQGFNNYNGSTGSEWSYIRADDSYTFSQAVQGLVSASMDPQELGYVSNYGDVAIIGYIDMDQQGNINQENSRLRLEIWDDYARMGSASEIALAFNRLDSYNYNGNQINLVFDDGFGQIIVSGELNQYDFYGTVSYQNAVSYDGTSSKAAGVLGTFQVPSCAFFRCQ